MINLKSISAFSLSVATLLLNSSISIAAPLLQEGKSTLYQRVLSTPTCKLSSETSNQGAGKAVPAFSRYYVYQRQQIEDKELLEVGPDSFGKTVGWVDAACTVPWNMQMTLVFTNPAERDPLLFFKDREIIENIIDAEDPTPLIEPIRENLANHQSSPEILAQEPDTYINFQENFYLLPILQGEEIMNGRGFYERILEVASVSKERDLLDSERGNNQEKSTHQEITDFKAAVVFVIDSTISMDPYIDKTKEVVSNIYKKIEEEKLTDQVKFGLIAFRSNMDGLEKLEYTTKLFADPSTVKDGQDFLDKVASLKQASVSTKEFNEDAYAGINEALNQVNWSNFGGRYIVLITDAGAIEGNNSITTTGLDAKQLRLEAQHHGVAIYALHLKTPIGKKNHEYAQSQYTELTYNDFLNKPLYYPVDTGNVDKFGDSIDQLAAAITSQVKLAYSGEMAAGSALTAESKEVSPRVPEQSEIEKDALILGRAMQLAYLGDIKGTKAPSVFKAWITDRDFIDSTKPTAEARVLMTKAQLADLSEVVKQIAEAANSGLISPTDMFAQLRSVAATMGQDPNQIKDSSSTKIADLGLLGEYLDDIPYRSQITALDEDTWAGMSIQEQEKFVRELYSKLRHYRIYNEDQTRWVSLSEESDPRDYVYPIPLEALP